MKNNISLSYPAQIDEADDGFTVTFPDLPFGVTCGNTYNHALENARDCLLHIVDMLFDEEGYIPMPVERDDLPKITLSKEMSDKVRKHNDKLEAGNE